MSDQPSLRIATDGPAVARAFADYLVQRLATSTGKISWSLSGGSTPKLLFRLLAEEYREKIDWSRLHFFWGDERCVPHDDPESNFGEVRKLLFEHVPVVPEQIHAVPTHLPPAEAAAAYSATMRKILPANADGVPVIDINMLGMGGDGHTASIFPANMETLLPATEVCAVAVHPESGQQRVTMTGTTLNASAEVVFLVTGAGKTQRVAQILNQEANATDFPVAHIRSAAGLPIWFLDEAAAAGVQR